MRWWRLAHLVGSLAYFCLFLIILIYTDTLISLTEQLVYVFSLRNHSKLGDFAIPIPQRNLYRTKEEWPRTFRVRMKPLLTPKSLRCAFNSTPSLALFVKTRPREFYQRKAIRETWGKSYRGQLTFVTGLTSEGNTLSNRETQNFIKLESEQYGDILQFDFTDTYHNLTLKNLATFDWLLEHCSGADFYFYGDSDAALYPDNIRPFLEKRRTLKRTIFGRCWKVADVIRDGKWEVSPFRYPSNHFPSYCAGAAYFMSADVPARLMRVLDRDAAYFHIDDVYVTGILAEKAGVGRVKAPGVMYLSGIDGTVEKCECLRMIASFEHGSSALLYEAWNTYIKQTKECS